ncbi:MAG: DinB family protein [Anaerolineae bacterium]|nr:DinB family protein [Anaerolineae bacterium]
MGYENTIQRIHNELIETFDHIDKCFELPADLRQFQPAKDQWAIDEILEHITLTSHFLMITLNQSLTKALKRAQEQPIPNGESQLDRIVQISDPDVFGWIRPEHMEPTRQVTSLEVRRKMKEQRDECLNILSQIGKGEGALHRVRMSVRDLGKLDMYEWLYFLTQHARRHMVEIERICILYYQQP